MPELPFGTTPVQPAPYAALKELLAAKAERRASPAPHPTAVGPDEFWAETLETPDSDGAAPLSEADLATLERQYCKLEKTPKPPESLSYVPMTIIVNVLSLAGVKACPLPNGQVVGWFLNPNQLLFGDPYAWSLKPDMVAYLVPRKTAEDYLARLQSKTTLSNLNDLCPSWAQVISAAELKVSAPGQSIISKPFVAIGPTSSQWSPYPPSQTATNSTLLKV